MSAERSEGPGPSDEYQAAFARYLRSGVSALTGGERSVLRGGYGDAAGVTDRAVWGVRMMLASRQVLDDQPIDIEAYLARQVAWVIGLEGDPGFPA